jgi:ERCC4-related helicase
VGALVRARGREWVVNPGSTDDLLLLRPLGGTDAETAGVLTALEEVNHATFGLPDPTRPGDHRSARLLRDAIKLGFRSGAGPFRSFARIAVEPRPYQLVPLLMALKMDPVRLLIADDVGIGKTIEAALIARELIDTGVVQRLAVLCPPHLAGQWQKELSSKFHIDATLVLASTAARLERECVGEQTIFDLHPFVIVSTDFIKAERRRRDFQRTCPELVIVDEAHTATLAGQYRGARQQRHELLKGLAADRSRHLLLVTATPHSGKDDAFRSLLALLDPDLAQLPDDLTGQHHEGDRRRLAKVMVQRRRGDITRYVDTETPFPAREEREEPYQLSKPYKDFFDKVLRFCRESVRDREGGLHRQRVRYWSALALLRSVASSPDAAVETLKNRARTAETRDADAADAVGRGLVMDEVLEEDVEDSDPGADFDLNPEGTVSRRLKALAKEASALAGESDLKLQRVTSLLKELLENGYRPIVFCRFIPTADYLASRLRESLKGVDVIAVTGTIPSDEREKQVLELSTAEHRILVATDCLSEGINLQEHFDAVVHYDLAWNPTRHEQREGRVDRYGQKKKTVRVLTMYGRDNRIDGVVLDVLLRKHRAIRKATGVSVPVPVDSEGVVEAILEGLLLRTHADEGFEQLVLLDKELKPKQELLFADWERAADRERRSQTMFAQESIKPEEVARELRDARAAAGEAADVRAFVRVAVPAVGGTVVGNGVLQIDVSSVPLALRETIVDPRIEATFEQPPTDRQIQLVRTHPFIASLASYILDTALDPAVDKPSAGRCGVIRSRAVQTRVTLLVVRNRFHLKLHTKRGDRTLLAEECDLLGFQGSPSAPTWLEKDATESLLGAAPSGNVSEGQKSEFLLTTLENAQVWSNYLADHARRRADALVSSHNRVRTATGIGGSAEVEAHRPDILGVYVLLPDTAG